MNIIVTGGAGFIGSNIVDRLVKLNHKVAIIDNLSTGKEENINNKAKFYKVDIRNNKKVLEVFDEFKPEVCIHHAAQIDIQKSIKNPKFDADVNIIGTINVLEACRINKVKKIIYASSAAVYGNPKYLPIDERHKTNPISYYGISKRTPEYYIKAFSEFYGIKFTILRYANVYGIRQAFKGEGGVIAIFLNKIIKKETPVIYGDGEQTRDFIYVKDIVNANIAALTKGNNETINISTNNKISINELVKHIMSISKRDFNHIYASKREGDILHSYINNEKAKKLLNWEPEYFIEEGLKETYQYYNGLYNKGKQSPYV
ncbi:NAD-dependent epimerase/dehydratase family protein [Clostridium sp. ZS2-4]|uniref:NAD-dependent epimerase/dehydratase family protein n=1 Tax=Clostridium sp. ZS2-4 TaxID=2987703 RepID=UPI00227AC762|nr:NAD-dependent epimerase/dehydratase family protein [Clostridium sp. ZS2-4]MCY6356046.1 GDP-mannose 4,6-dehydratase [Clostridium sp. ZS2-4]